MSEATKRDDVALWANIVLLHLWGAVGYLKPGWFPAVAGATTAVIVVLIAWHGAAQQEPKP